jgi:pimeloyl-ACP methyl ester carboxylesterase
MSRTGFVQKVLKRSSLVQDAWTDADLEIFAERWRDPARAHATVSLYRTWLTRELRPLLAGKYNDQRLSTPTLILVGEGDPVMSVDRMGGYESHADDLTLQEVPGAGHWTAEEQPDAVLERMGAFYGVAAGA